MFSAFSLNDRLLKSIDKIGFREPTPVQAQVIPLAIAGKDLLVSAETGSGKTAAFLLPTLHRLLIREAPLSGTRVLILAPTRELARQILKHFKQLSGFTHLQAALVSGGHDFKYQRALFRKNPEVIIATPGRLVEHISQGTPDFNDLEVLIIDEADRMLDMGFSEDMATIVNQCNDARQTLLFSATLGHKGIQGIASRLLTKPVSVSLSSAKTPHSDISQQIILADHVRHKEHLLAWLLAHETYEKALVFSNTRAQADRLGGFIRYHKQKAAVLHGEMDQKERNRVMDLFRRGHVNILIATDVAARGLDVQGVDLVINFEMARSGDDYVHRIGRTGRAGRQGLAISLISSPEWNLMASIERYLKVKFERRSISELTGAYKGPKKLKSSGKAAGSKKKKLVKKAAAKAGTKKKPAKASKDHRPNQAGPKKRRPATDAARDGFAPLKRRKNPDENT